MAISHTFIIPEFESTSEGTHEGWINTLSGWLHEHNLGSVTTLEPSGVGVIRQKDNTVMELSGGDVLVVDGDNLRFATMDEVEQMRQAVKPIVYELVFTSADSTTRSAHIVADQVQSDDHYLIFSREGRLVQAVAHNLVREFSDSGLTPGELEGQGNQDVAVLDDARDQQKANRFML